MHRSRWFREERRPATALPSSPHAANEDETERYYIASERELIWRKFRKHKLAIVSGVVLVTAVPIGGLRRIHRPV